MLQPKFDDKSYTLVGEPGGTWDQSEGQTNFEQQFTAHPNINAVVAANDNHRPSRDLGAQEQGDPGADDPGRPGRTRPVVGLQNVLAGYQCGSVYKPIYRRGPSSSRARAVPPGRRRPRRRRS